jgi:spore coat polysaccharide biosynthesis predicted glycosyltransferase SpsG
MVLLVCHAAPAVGLGHLSRMLVLAKALRQTGLECRLLICGEITARKELEAFPWRCIADNQSLCDEIARISAEGAIDGVVFDLHPRRIPHGLTALLEDLGRRKIARIAVDGMLDHAQRLALVWLPSFYMPPDRRSDLPSHVRFGWDRYLIRRHPAPPEWQPGMRVLVLTGGSDATGLGRLLPRLLDAGLPSGTTVCWVQGPYADPPALPEMPSLSWSVERSPEGLANLLAESHYVLTVYGVSLFEAMQCGRPTVVFSPYGDKDERELEALAGEGVAVVAESADAAAAALVKLMVDAERSRRLAATARSCLAVDGGTELAREIAALLPASV